LSVKAGIEMFFVEGEFECEPGLGVQGIYDGPFYSFYDWSTSNAEEAPSAGSLEDAYSLIYQTIEDEGPFDGILGFSQGSATAYGFLAHHASKRPLDPLFRCAVFFNGLPPFKVQDNCAIYETPADAPVLKIPSLHVIGKKDFVRPHSLALLKLMDPASSMVLEHSGGHEIPRDRINTTHICDMMERLCRRATW
jgi:hypothetical protein